MTTSSHPTADGKRLAGLRLPNLLLIAIGAWAIAHDPILVKDTVSYVESAVFRSALYPLLLSLLRTIFGGHANVAAVVLQTGLVLIAAAQLSKYLESRLDLRTWQVLVVTALLAAPILAPLEVGNRILTEAIAYFFFLMAVRFLLVALETRNRFPTVAFFILSALCALTRTQFLFLYALAGLLLLWLAIPGRDWRGAGLLALALVATIGAGSAVDRGYRYWKHNEFISIPFKGLQLMAPALYLSEPFDEARLDPGRRELFRALRDRASGAGQLVESNPDPGGVSSYAYHYSQVFADIVWQTIARGLAEHDLGKPMLSSAQDYIAAERTLQPMALQLIQARPRAHLRLYVSNLLGGLGVSYALLLILIGPLLLWQGFVSRRPLAMVTATCLILHLANCGFVALIAPVWPRYTFYTDWLLLAALFLLVCEAFGTKRAPKESW